MRPTARNPQRVEAEPISPGLRRSFPVWYESNDGFFGSVRLLFAVLAVLISLVFVGRGV